MHKVKALLWDIPLPPYFDTERNLENLKDILTIHDHYSAHLVASATGCTLADADAVLDALVNAGRVSVIYEISDNRRTRMPYAVAFTKELPTFPMRYESPSSGKRIKLTEEHAVVERNYLLTDKYKEQG